MKVIFFDQQIKKFISKLEQSSFAKTLQMIGLVEELGPNLRMPYSKKISSNLFELRIIGKQEVRIFYSFYKNEIFLLHGFVKKSQRIPKKELEAAKSKLIRLAIE